MGKGISLQFKEAYPNNYILYRNACKDKLVCVGSIDDSTVSVPCYHCNRYRLYRCNRYQDFSSAFRFAKVIYFFNFWRIESPFNSILLAFATKRSIMASAKVGSPM